MVLGRRKKLPAPLNSHKGFLSPLLILQWEQHGCFQNTKFFFIFNEKKQRGLLNTMQRILFIKKFSSKYFCQELNNRLSFYTLICRKKFSGGDFMIMIIIVECVDDDHRSEGHSGGLLAQHAIWGILDIFLWKTQQMPWISFVVFSQE